MHGHGPTLRRLTVLDSAGSCERVNSCRRCVSAQSTAAPYGRTVARLRNVAVVLAGGTGTRVGLAIPKQLIKVAGRPIMEHTISLLQASPLVDEIIVL